MKFVIAFLLTALLSFAGSLFFPWWIIAVAAFVVALVVPQSSLMSFVSAFFALFVLWAVHASIIDQQNEHLLSTKIASILPLHGSYIAIIIVTAFVGGLVAGISALTGSFARGRRGSAKQA